VGDFQRSSIRMKINRGDWEGAADSLLLYCMAGGKILLGLKKRRDAEKALFLS
jgi:GH24 family phage-related lysozyme (muramidase)